MIIYKYKKIPYFVQAILIGTIAPLITVYLIYLIFGEVLFGKQSSIIFLLPWILVNLVLTIDFLHELILDDSKLCRKTFLFQNTIDWNEVTKIEFEPFRKKTTFLINNTKKIVIHTGYNNHESLYLHMNEFLSKNEKDDLIPESLIIYVESLKSLDHEL